MSSKMTTKAAPVREACHSVSARYLVQGASDPGLLPRLVEPFAKLGTVPSRVHASREAGDGSDMTVDLRLNGVERRTAELIEVALRRVVGVRQLIAVVEGA
ncbi:MAG: hypothetical protein JSS20_04005 [Proteobacteria bacterium]|nr:hypothetical protein [Pseudomonadota bacterium]